MIRFTVSQDPDYGFIVHSTESKALSFALVPVSFNWRFDSEFSAKVQADWLSRLGAVKTRMIETPDRFEAVADTKYGSAW